MHTCCVIVSSKCRQYHRSTATMMELRHGRTKGSSIDSGLRGRHQRQRVHINYYPQPFWHSDSTSLDVPGGANLSGPSVVVQGQRVRFGYISAHAGVDRFAIGLFDRSSACKVEPTHKMHLYISIWLQHNRCAMRINTQTSNFVFVKHGVYLTGTNARSRMVSHSIAATSGWMI